MEIYLYTTIISLALVYAFIRMGNNWLRNLFIFMFSGLALYQGIFLATYWTHMKHGTWYSFWGKLPFLIGLLLLLIYILKERNDRFL